MHRVLFTFFCIFFCVIFTVIVFNIYFYYSSFISYGIYYIEFYSTCFIFIFDFFFLFFSFFLDVKASSESPGVRRKIEDDLNKTRNKGYDETSNALNSNNIKSNQIDKDNTRFIADQQTTIKQSITIQDDQLDSLGRAVDHLTVIGTDINQEIKEQNVMLDGLETDLDDAGNKMGVVMASLSKLLKTKDGCQIWTIVILAVILIILIALIIWV